LNLKAADPPNDAINKHAAADDAADDDDAKDDDADAFNAEHASERERSNKHQAKPATETCSICCLRRPRANRMQRFRGPPQRHALDADVD